MAVLVVYDSVYGNTGEIARAVARGIESGGDRVTLRSVAEMARREEKHFELIVVGSPTRGFSATPAMEEFLAGLSGPGKAAVFDTRLDLETVHPAPLRWVIGAGGYAADRMAALLERKGYDVEASRGDFMVMGAEGPLKDGELERAEAWGKTLFVK